MPSTTLPGGASGFYAYMHNETVTGGNGNLDISIMGKGSVTLGNGNDGVFITKSGYISVGSGADTLALAVGGTINQTGTTGNDSISLGTGSDSISEQGHATVMGTGAYNSFGTATISGGVLSITHAGGITVDTAVSGDMTVKGGATAPTEFVGGTGSSDFIGKNGADTFIGGSGNDTMSAVGGNNVFEFELKGGTHTVLNFVSTDSLYVGGMTYSELNKAGDITHSTVGGVTSTTITVSGTTITLKGFDLDSATKGVVIGKEIKH